MTSTSGDAEVVNQNRSYSVTNRNLAAFSLIALLVVMRANVAAQTTDAIAGVWERTSNKNLTTGVAPDEPSRPLRVIYHDGYFIQFRSAAGRAKLDPATRPTWTKEQLAVRIRMQGQSGTYKLLGSTGIMHNIEMSGDPRNEGTQTTSELRFEEDTLVMIRTLENRDRIETRFRRLK